MNHPLGADPAAHRSGKATADVMAEPQPAPQVARDFKLHALPRRAAIADVERAPSGIAHIDFCRKPSRPKGPADRIPPLLVKPAEMDRKMDATKTFYAALNGEQKKVFDAESARMLGGGHHGHHGHGRG